MQGEGASAQLKVGNLKRELRKDVHPGGVGEGESGRVKKIRESENFILIH